MASTLKYIHLFILSTCGTLLLFTVFANDPSLANGMVTGKTCWFHLIMLFLSAGCLFVGVTLRKKPFSFSVADGLVLLLGASMLITYQWELNPDPEKMIFIGQLILLWFILRCILNWYPQLRLLFLFIILCTGLAEAIWGTRQLHGFEASNHSLYNITGSFYNPGPYSGYIAMILPISLWLILRFRNCNKSAWWKPTTYLYFFAWIVFIAIVVVLPAGMSRTAWIAATVSCGWVCWKQCFGWKKTKDIFKRHRAFAIITSIIVTSIFVGSLAGIYLIKKDSANGRLLMWKVTANAIRKAPFTGTGIGGFPAAFAEAQAEYFASGKATGTEKLVAGTPEYAFNEFLQIGLEQGVLGLLFFVLLLGYSLYQGVRNRQVGAVGGVFALILFACASYPLQLPEFWVVLVVLLGIANASRQVKTNTPSASSGESKSIHFSAIMLSILLTVVVVVGSGSFFLLQKSYYKAYKQWKSLKNLYDIKAYDKASNEYVKLLPQLDHKPKFLFEAAQCLSQTGEYEKANVLLERAMKLSTDPMIHYIAAKNEQALKKYQNAENLLLHAIDMLPERIYPYYLLAKLYTEPTFNQEDKFFNAASAVMEKEPKVESTAIKEMRTEVKNMLNNIRNNRN